MHTPINLLAQSSAGSAIGGLIFLVIYLGLIVLVIAGFWKTFQKAGQPGWAAIVPIYNIYILTKIAGRPWWFLLLCFVPIANIVVSALIAFDVAKAFGKSQAFGVGLWLLAPIFYCIVGFGSAQYQGPPQRAPGALI